MTKYYYFFFSFSYVFFFPNVFTTILSIFAVLGPQPINWKSNKRAKPGEWLLGPIFHRNSEEKMYFIKCDIKAENYKLANFVGS